MAPKLIDKNSWRLYGAGVFFGGRQVAKDGSEQAKLNLRMPEALRERIERYSEQRGVSMNAAIIGRLLDSFDREQTISEAVEAALMAAFGSAENYAFGLMVATVKRMVEANTGDPMERERSTTGEVFTTLKRALDDMPWPSIFSQKTASRERAGDLSGVGAQIADKTVAARRTKE